MEQSTVVVQDGAALLLAGNGGEQSAMPLEPLQRAREGFVLPDIDEDIRADFAAVGITFAGDQDGSEISRDEFEAMEQAKREALAAMMLRRAALRDREIEQARAAMQAEIDLITMHYERRMEGPTRDRDACIRLVEHLAMLSAESGGFGRKKSADTPWGTFGIRDRSATVELIDRVALCKHYANVNPLMVSVTAHLPLSRAKLLMNEAELAECKTEPIWGSIKKTLSPDGELPPGVAKVDATREAYAVPRVPFTGVDVAA